MFHFGSPFKGNNFFILSAKNGIITLLYRIILHMNQTKINNPVLDVIPITTFLPVWCESGFKIINIRDDITF